LALLVAQRAADVGEHEQLVRPAFLAEGRPAEFEASGAAGEAEIGDARRHAIETGAEADVTSGPSEQLFARPAHPYTALLIEAIPMPDPDVRPAETVSVGEPPSPISPPSGCRFRTRCPRADQQCKDEVPELRVVGPGQFVACHHPLI